MHATGMSTSMTPGRKHSEPLHTWIDVRNTMNLHPSGPTAVVGAEPEEEDSWTKKTSAHRYHDSYLCDSAATPQYKTSPSPLSALGRSQLHTQSTVRAYTLTYIAPHAPIGTGQRLSGSAAAPPIAANPTASAHGNLHPSPRCVLRRLLRPKRWRFCLADLLCSTHCRGCEL